MNYTISHSDDVEVDVEHDSEEDKVESSSKPEAKRIENQHLKVSPLLPSISELTNSSKLHGDRFDTSDSMSGDKKEDIALSKLVKTTKAQNTLPSILSFAQASSALSSPFKNKKTVKFAPEDDDSETETDEELEKNEASYEERIRTGSIPVAEYEEIVTSSSYADNITVANYRAVEDHTYSSANFVQHEVGVKEEETVPLENTEEEEQNTNG